MKAIKYFLYALIATFVFAGCSDDPTYTRGESEADGCYGVYFPSQDNAADLELDPADPTVLTFTAMRTNDADAITVPVTVTGSEDAIFSASEISFDDGATETTFQVSFPMPKSVRPIPATSRSKTRNTPSSTVKRLRA